IKRKNSLLFLLVLLPYSLFAQTQSESLDLKEVEQEVQQQAGEGQKSKPSNNNDDVEKVEVTGSHIKRINVEGPSPIAVIDREDLDRSAQTSVADVLREQTASSFGGLKEHSGSNAAGVAHVNLRGLGSSKTLV